jgi:hypothetical protein
MPKIRPYNAEEVGKNRPDFAEENPAIHRHAHLKSSAF